LPTKRLPAAAFLVDAGFAFVAPVELGWSIGFSSEINFFVPIYH